MMVYSQLYIAPTEHTQAAESYGVGRCWVTLSVGCAFEYRRFLYEKGGCWLQEEETHTSFEARFSRFAHRWLSRRRFLAMTVAYLTWRGSGTCAVAASFCDSSDSSSRSSFVMPGSIHAPMAKR